MKIKIDVGIYGTPTRLNLSIKLLYGKNDLFEHKLVRKEFSLDKGGSLTLPLNYFEKAVEDFIK